MIDVLGLELTHAVNLLKAEGYAVETTKVSSRKGMPGNEKRIIRQQAVQGEHVDTALLSYALFQTDCCECE